MFVLAMAAALLPIAASATILDLGAALQDFDPGDGLEEVELNGDAFVHVRCINLGGGPDLCIVFDSECPSGGDVDLGTPNQDFGGPGDGKGGGEGAEGENDEAFGKVLIIAEENEDEDDDGRVDDPDDESGGGIVKLFFSHAGRLSLCIIDVDEDEEAPRLVLYKEKDVVAEVEGESPGDNSVQCLNLESAGDVDGVVIHLDGSAAIAEIELDVPAVGVEGSTWSTLKAIYR
jgi:hypothetical protein